MTNMSVDRLRWLVHYKKHLTLAGAVEIAKAAPDLLALIERLQGNHRNYANEDHLSRPDSGRRDGWR